jgi:hypothetical protein
VAPAESLRVAVGVLLMPVRVSPRRAVRGAKQGNWMAGVDVAAEMASKLRALRMDNCLTALGYQTMAVAGAERTHSNITRGW